MRPLDSQTCAYHPERSGYSLCMSCRKVVCQECATAFEGVNYCRPCLAAKTKVAGPDRQLLPWLFALGLLALLLVASARAMVWSGAILARLW